MTVHRVVVEVLLAGQVSDFADADTRQRLAADLAVAAGIDVSRVLVTIAAASVRVQFSIVATSSAGSEAIAATLGSTLATIASTSQAFPSVNLTVTAVPTVNTMSRALVLPAPSAPPPAQPPLELIHYSPSSAPLVSTSTSNLASGDVESSTMFIAVGAACGALAVLVAVGIVWRTCSSRRANNKDAQRQTHSAATPTYSTHNFDADTSVGVRSSAVEMEQMEKI